jgi:NDP-sugar pyrophosphorylase family protein
MFFKRRPKFTGPVIPEEAMVMTAGLGSRLKPFTLILPKPLIPILGIPCAWFAYDLLRRYGVRRAVSNLHYLAGMTEMGLRTLVPASAVELSFSDERETLLGSAGGVRKALPQFRGERFFTLNADTVCPADLGRLAHFHAEKFKSSGARLTLLLVDRPEGAYRGVRVDANGRVVGLDDLGVQGGGHLFSGISIAERSVFEGLPEGSPLEWIPEIFNPLVARGEVFALHMPGVPFFDIGSAELWSESHFRILDLLASRPEIFPDTWRERIFREVRQVSAGMWISAAHRDPDISGWKSPAIWIGNTHPPRSFGPDAILYGACLNPQQTYANGIGLDGEWIEF